MLKYDRYTKGVSVYRSVNEGSNMKTTNINKIYVKCPNKECALYNISFSKANAGISRCSSCDSVLMECTSKHWLIELVENKTIWIDEAAELWPSVVAFEYYRLKERCKKADSYGVLLCLKDNIEVLLKFETLISYAWAAQNMDIAFEEETISQITTPNLSLGAWSQLSKIIIQNLKKRDVDLPASIPLKTIINLYEKYKLVNWRNDKIGHGAMGFDEDLEYQKDLTEKIYEINDIYKSIDKYLSKQTLILSNLDKTIYLKGCKKARNLEYCGEVFLILPEDDTRIKINPFINICKNDKNGYGVYFFDNQKKTTLSVFLAYAEGVNFKQGNAYFERLRNELNSKDVQIDNATDNPYKSVKEYRELDNTIDSGNYLPQRYLINWVGDCLKRNNKGIFLLEMARGMGKSVFTEKINSLFENYTRIDEELEVRTYHLNRTQIGGQRDILAYIEWMWDHDFTGEKYLDIQHYYEFKAKGYKSSTAFAKYLESVLLSRNNRNHSKKILMVFDGIDEIVDENIFEIFPDSKELIDGIYILFTSRSQCIMDDPLSINNSKRIIPNEKLVKDQNSSKNYSFLCEYINERNKGLFDKTDELIALSSYRILDLSLLCRMIENGIAVEEIRNPEMIAKKYLEILYDRYGDKDYNQITEILMIIIVLGNKEALSLQAIGQLSSINNVTIRMIGMMKDILPFIDVERNTFGNSYRIANEEIGEELLGFINNRHCIIRGFVDLALAVIEEQKIPERYSGDEIVCAHVADLAMLLPEGLDAIKKEKIKLFIKFIDICEKEIHSIHDKETVLKYNKQLYIINNYLFGETNHNTIVAEHNYYVMLLNIESNEGICDRIEKLYLRAKDCLGENNIDTITILDTLAGAYESLGHHDKSLKIRMKVADYFTKGKGIKHPDVLVFVRNYASSLCTAGYYDKATELFMKVLEYCKEHYGNDNKETLIAQADLAVVYSSTGKSEVALGLLEDAYQKMSVDNPLSDMVINIHSNFASTLCDLGRFSDALKHYEIIYENKKQVYGCNHPETIDTLSHIGLQYGKLGDYDKALEIMGKAYELALDKLGESHPVTISIQSYYSELLRVIGESDKAYELLSDAYEKAHMEMSEETDMTIDLKNSMAFILSEQGNKEEALSLLKDVFYDRKKLYGYNNKRTLIAQRNYAVCFVNIGDYEKAYSLMIDLYEREKELLGEEDDETKDAKSILSKIQEFIKTDMNKE